MIKLVLSDQMVAAIGDALAEQPFRISAPVIAEIQKQINEQKANGLNGGPPQKPEEGDKPNAPN